MHIHCNNQPKHFSVDGKQVVLIISVFISLLSSCFMLFLFSKRNTHYNIVFVTTLTVDELIATPPLSHSSTGLRPCPVNRDPHGSIMEEHLCRSTTCVLVEFSVDV